MTSVEQGEKNRNTEKNNYNNITDEDNNAIKDKYKSSYVTNLKRRSKEEKEEKEERDM